MENLTRVALIGNPNVGKSTLFNAITGLNQHTGNWAGKTVEVARGRYRWQGEEYEITDLPGTYSLYAHSKEEEVAAGYILKGEYDVAVVVLDASMPKRGMALALQVMAAAERTVLCFNLIRAGEKRGIHIDILAAEGAVSARVCAVDARKRRTLSPLFECISAALSQSASPPMLKYHSDLSEYIDRLGRMLVCRLGLCSERGRFLASMLLSSEQAGRLVREAFSPESDVYSEIIELRDALLGELIKFGIDMPAVSDMLAQAQAQMINEICSTFVSERGQGRARLDKLLDRILTGKYTAYPVMLLLFFFILYLTIGFANYPSNLLSSLFDAVGRGFYSLLIAFQAPPWLVGLLYEGVYTVLAKVVSVMLPPMAIFFPLFTLLEDMGFLPRFAYNLDAPFRCVGGCGKQGLTMCMGLGCNASGVVGCRIIDSPSERRMAILTNSFMPCNGRFPTVILLLGIIFGVGSAYSPALTALGLLLVIILGALATFFTVFILSHTLYRSGRSFFTIEMPSYRPPDLGRVLVRSFLDRTLSVLWRAVIVAIPAGALIWMLSFVTVDGQSLLYYMSEFLDPVGRALGFDGVMLSAFILGWPAGEIVIPIALIGYSGMGTADALALSDIGSFLCDIGWTPITAISVIIFTLFHWPCTTTLLTVYKETGSIKSVALSALLPTALGALICLIINLIF